MSRVTEVTLWVCDTCGSYGSEMAERVWCGECLTQMKPARFTRVSDEYAEPAADYDELLQDMKHRRAEWKTK